MRIAFMGKGGSGKTTLTGGFTRFIKKKYPTKDIIVIDADINVHLQELLEIKGKPKYLGNLQEEIQKHVLGKRTDIKVGEFPPTTIPSNKSQFIYPHTRDKFIKKYGIKKENLSLLTIGKFETEDVGHSCYHGKLNSLEIFFHHLIDDKDNTIITDAVTGIDNFGTSLRFCYDLNIFVVEPTKKSISVFKDYKKLAEKNNVQYKVVINKVHNNKDIEFVHKHIDKEMILGSIENAEDVRKWEQGDSKAFGNFVHNNTKIRSSIESHLNSLPKNRELYLERLLKCHYDNSTEWRNDYYKKNFINEKNTFNYTTQIGQTS